MGRQAPVRTDMMNPELQEEGGRLEQHKNAWRMKRGSLGSERNPHARSQGRLTSRF